MKNFKVITHAQGAPGLRFLGIGPGFMPSQGLRKLQELFNNNAFWAQERSQADIKVMLANSQVVVTAWENERLIGFGRATSDKCFRATLWDLIVSNKFRNKGVGKKLLLEIMKSKSIKNVEKVYLFSTQSVDFYKSMGFNSSFPQQSLVKSIEKITTANNK
tara:strand:+ start:113 stop:595 length:483 start_codon:yes stop_codon:yes gene_type:complete